MDSIRGWIRGLLQLVITMITILALNFMSSQLLLKAHNKRTCNKKAQCDKTQ